MSSIALAHHWLVTYRGGEKVLGEFRRLFPDAPVATLVLERGQIPDWIIGSNVITSWIQHIPAAPRFYKQLLILHPSAFKRLWVSSTARLVLSSDAGMVKGLRLPEGAKHVCYCHSPPRYLWDMQDDYASNTAGLGCLGRAVFSWIVPYAREFDFQAAQRVDAFIANSRFVAERIRRCYGQPADVIYPPVAVNDFDPNRAEEGFYLLVSQLVSYKRVDIAVRAFTALGKRLVIIGEGSEAMALARQAGPSITFMGKQPFRIVREKFETCRAFIHPQIEDFGIAAVEAQAAGRPVIAFRAGGALETVKEGETGWFFDAQNPEALAQSILEFEKQAPVSRTACRAHAEQFGQERFRNEIKALLIDKFPDIFADYQFMDKAESV